MLSNDSKELAVAGFLIDELEILNPEILSQE